MDCTKEDYDASRTQVSERRRRCSELAHSEGDIKQGSPSKQPRIEQRPQSISSTQLAYSVMKFRLGGSVSDPLNLEGDSGKQTDGECSTCAPSPALPSGQLSPVPQHLQKDPLNIEGRTKTFSHNKQTSGMQVFFSEYVCICLNYSADLKQVEKVLCICMVNQVTKESQDIGAKTAQNQIIKMHLR